MITFITGGARSGKSSVAVAMASEHDGQVCYIATARADDEEMAQRIEKHRRHRPDTWNVVEAPVDLTGAIAGVSDEATILIDCVTLWISNLMVERDDSEIFETIDEVVDAIAGRSAATIVVSNEVGSGLVPMDPVGRRFRDLHGWANQRFAAAADDAFLIVAGRRLRLT